MCRCCSRMSCDSFYLNYKELKQIVPVEVKTRKGVFILTMRNWNTRSMGPITHYQTVFILTIRNWNASRPVRILLADGFYLNYEELKPVKTASIPATTLRFYLNYEELKLDKLIYRCNCPLGFYLNYEELKHCSHRGERSAYRWFLS